MRKAVSRARTRALSPEESQKDEVHKRGEAASPGRPASTLPSTPTVIMPGGYPEPPCPSRKPRDGRDQGRF